MNKIRVAILGATSHIAKGLINNFHQDASYSLYLYARNREKIERFLQQIQANFENISIYQDTEELFGNHFDVLINSVGVGTPDKIANQPWKWLTVTEQFDNLCLSYLLKTNLEALYISFSSGTIYGDFAEPADKKSVWTLDVNAVEPSDYYAIARLHAETKHRAYAHLNIVDLRIFSYFSRFISLNDRYFLTEIIDSILSNKQFITNDHNIVRDYIHPDDLYTLIKVAISKRPLNDAFDVCSAAPVSKREMLKFFEQRYQLQYTILENKEISSGTGQKDNYYSTFSKAKEMLHFGAQYTSLEAVQNESEYIIGKRKNLI